MSDGTPFLRVAADRIGAPGSPAKMPFRATNAANWSPIIRIGAKMAVIRRRIARRAVSSHTQRAGRVPYGESRLKSLRELPVVSATPDNVLTHTLNPPLPPRQALRSLITQCVSSWYPPSRYELAPRSAKQSSGGAAFLVLLRAPRGRTVRRSERRLTWPHGSRARPSAPATGSRKAPAPAPAAAPGSHPCPRAWSPIR